MTDQTEPPFILAERGHARQARPITTLSDLETAAAQAAMLVARGDVELQHAADRLWDIAEKSGIAARQGGDDIQDRLLAVFNSVDHRLDAEDTGLIATRMDGVEMKAVEWLWPQRIAIGKVTTLAGEGGLGKSTLLFDIAARVSRGDSWPDGDIRSTAGVALILSAEDDPADTVKPRLLAAGADMARVFFLSMRRDEDGVARGFDLQADLAQLEATIRALGHVRLVVIDPVSAYLGKADGNGNAAVRAVLGALGDMAARRKVAVICNTHFSKAEARRVNQRVIGSVAFVNQSRMVFVVMPDPADRDRRLLLPSKSNIARLESGLAFRIAQTLVGEAASIVATRIVWENAPVAIAADAALAALRQSETGSKSAKAEAVEFLSEVLADGPKPASEVIEMAGAMGLGDKPLRAARKQLGIKPAKTGFQAQYVWALPMAPS